MLEYRSHRTLEAKRKLNQDHGSLFHDGARALETVIETHSNILRSRQESNENDHITVQVLGLVSDMLQEDPEARVHTRYLYTKCDRLIKEAQEKLGIKAPNCEDRYMDGPVMIPPHTPPTVQRQSQLSAPSRSHYQGMVPGSDTPSPSPQISHFSVASISQIEESEDPDAAQPPQAPDPSNGDLSSLRQCLYGSGGLTVSTITPEAIVQPQIRSVMKVQEGLKIKEYKKSRVKREWPGEANLADLEQRDHVEHTLLPAKLQLTHRRQAFVVDNTESLKPHLPEVTQIIKLLPYMLKNSDPDGIDMYFTKSTRQLKFKKKTKVLLEALCEEKFVGISNITIRINQIFEDYKAKLDSRPGAGRSPFRRTRSTLRTRPLNVYILTNGMWEPGCDLASSIRLLVEDIRRRSLPKDQVRIQFIQFGERPECTAKLQHLDSGLRLE